MKNYLIKGMHRIESTEWWEGNNRSQEGDLYDLYSKMAVLSEDSFLHNLQGDWTLINLVSTASTIWQMHRQQFVGIWDIWNSESCNILYCGADTQMLTSTEVFGKYKHFVMWGHTDPPRLFDPPLAHYMNCDIRYYPAEMRQDLFEEALHSMTSNNEFWGADQIIYNKLMWGQGVPPEELVDHNMAYQAHWLPGDGTLAAIEYSNNWNGCAFKDANIIHWHGSRNAQTKLETMQGIHNIFIPKTPIKNIEIKTIDVSHIP